MCASRQDAVEPGLLVLVARRCEGGAGELLVVEAIWRFLRVIGANRQSALYGLSFMIAAESVLILVLFRQAELGDGHLGGELYEGRVRGERERESSSCDLPWVDLGVLLGDLIKSRACTCKVR